MTKTTKACAARGAHHGDRGPRDEGEPVASPHRAAAAAECEPSACPTWYDGCHCRDFPDLTASAAEVEELAPCELWSPERVREVVAELSSGDERAHLLDALRAPGLLHDGEALWLACRLLAERAPWLLAAWRLHAARRLARLAPRSADAARAVEVFEADLLVLRVRAAGGSCGEAAGPDERRAIASALRRAPEHFRRRPTPSPPAVSVALCELANLVENPEDLDDVLQHAHEGGSLPPPRAWRRHAARLVALASPRSWGQP
jgi:hypothetical protein